MTFLHRFRSPIIALRQSKPAQIVVAVPVGARESCERIRRLADRIVCLATPVPFSAVGQWYEDFAETSEAEVRQLLAVERPARSAEASAAHRDDVAGSPAR